MFDTNATIKVNIRKDGKQQQFLFRFPTDEEWGDWYGKRKTFMHSRGQGESTLDIDSRAADESLYAKIRTSEDGLDSSAASFVIDEIAKSDVTDAVMEGDQVVLTMRVAGNLDVEHVLRIPDTSDVFHFRKSAKVTMLQFGRQRIVNTLDPGVKLYNSCAVTTTGYESSVPALHKDAAIRAVIQLLENEANPGNE